MVEQNRGGQRKAVGVVIFQAESYVLFEEADGSDNTFLAGIVSGFWGSFSNDLPRCGWGGYNKEVGIGHLAFRI